MAKSNTTRVHLLAKELGVKSKAIIDKCQAEGLDIKNHMSTISVGLAATIREWFSEGAHTTAVETSKPVDLEKVRVPKKKKVVEKADEPEKEPEDEVLPDTEAQTIDVAAVTEAAPAVEQAEAVKEESKEAKPEDADSGKEEKPKAKPKRVRVVKKPKKPEPVVPAGPMLEKPEPAKLTGPTVIRVEKAEPTRPPRRGRPGGRDRYDKPISEPLMPQPLIPEIGEAVKGGKKSDKTRGRRKDDLDDAIERKGKGGRKMRARDFEERQARLAAARGETLRSRPVRKIETKKEKQDGISAERPEKATISEPITVKDLSSALAAKVSEIITKLMEQGIMATANHVIATDVAELIALELGTELIVEKKESLLQQIEAEFESRERPNQERRAPVVTMLGHVDHGKTSLLDRIRSTSVASGEAGGITQHIGAYQVEVHGKKVTFLDTPGHEAFTAMRARGANITDIVVLVVAADDGVMPQTIEAIHHAQAAGVQIIVALNKIDLPGVDINRIYGQLSEHGLTPSEWGGETEVVKTSATTGQGVDDLIEHLDYIADLKEYKADNTIDATGWVVESKMTTTQGVVATVLIKEGVLKKGDTILAGSGYGRVRTLKDSRGKSIKQAISSMPVELTGLSDVPQAGDKFFCLKDANRAKEAALENKAASREKSLAQRSQITLDNLFSQIEAGNVKELNLILKADVQGSVDVLIKYLTELSTEEVKINILHAAVGGITEGDVVLAQASGAIVIGFNVTSDEYVKGIADSNGVDIRLYNVIYRITEDLKAAMIGMLEPDIEEKQLGKCVVRNTFKVSSLGTIAGCYVNSGVITKNAKLRLIRDNIVIRDNCNISSLKHFKDDAREVKSGLECGIKIAGFDDIKIGDVFEAYEIIEVARTLL